MLVTLVVAGYFFALLAHMNHVYGGDARPDFLKHQLLNTIDLTPRLGAAIMFLDRQRAHHLFPALDHTRITGDDTAFSMTSHDQ